LKRQARQAIRYRNVSGEVRKVEATLYYLRWQGANAEVAESDRAKDLSVRAVAEATIAQSEAGKGREEAATGVPPLRHAEARAAEQTFGELTGALADLTARRNQLTQTTREQSERVARIESEIANIEAGLASVSESRPDVAALATALEGAQAAVTQAEQATVFAE